MPRFPAERAYTEEDTEYECSIELIPDSTIHHGGVMQPRTRGAARTLLRSDGVPVSDDLPDAIRDKLEIVQDPIGYKQRMLTNQFQKRTVLTSSAAILTPKPKGKSTGRISNRPVNKK